jgi:hypothetical protein
VLAEDRQIVDYSAISRDPGLRVLPPARHGDQNDV